MDLPPPPNVSILNQDFYKFQDNWIMYKQSLVQVEAYLSQIKLHLSWKLLQDK